MATFKNPIAYYKRAQAQNIDALNRVGVCAAGTTVYNGTLVTLGVMNTEAAKGMNYVFPATPVATSDGTAKDVWMVRAPEVPMDVCGNLYDDPRAFSVEGGRPFDMIRPMPGDIIHLSDAAFGANTKPDAVTNKFVYSDTDGEWQAAANGTGKGFVAKLQAIEAIPVGQEFVTGYVLEVVQNPTGALA